MAKKSIFSNLPSLPNLPGKRILGKKEESSKKEKSPKAKNPKPKLVFFIVDWDRENIISEVCKEEDVRFHFTSLGMGTAKSDVLEMLGLGSNEKAVVIVLEQGVGVPVLIKAVRDKLKNTGPGAGIAFTIPLSAINDPLLMIFKQDINIDEKTIASLSGGEGDKMSESKHTHDLILSVVNHGYSDELMSTAREAGARGGTVIQARSQAHEGAVKFFGVSVQEERELLLILTEREKKVSIMQAISEKHGLNSEAHGLILSLPVDDVSSLSLLEY